MNRYRFEIPATVCIDVEADTLAAAQRQADAIRHKAHAEAPDGYATDLAGTDAVLWVNDEGRASVIDGPEDELWPEEITEGQACTGPNAEIPF